MSVSVVISLYNKAAYVARALASVLRQTHTEFECIVVDDGSTDGGAAIVMAQCDTRIRLVQQGNVGVSRARNRGVEEARHPLVAFLDADDEWDPAFLAEAVRMHAASPHLVACFTNFRKGYRHPAELHPAEGPGRILADYFRFCLENAGVGMNASSVVVAREALRSIGGFPVGRNHGEDLDTWFRLALSGPVAYIPSPLSIYHEQCGHSSQSGAANLDVMPTLKAWEAKGLVRHGHRKHAAAFATLCRHRTIFFLSGAGLRREGLRLHRDLLLRDRFGLYGVASYLSLRAYPLGRVVFAATERLNRMTARLRWRAPAAG